MNKNDMITRIAEENSMSKALATGALNTVLTGIVDTLQNGEVAAFQDFGSFKCQTSKARSGRNPRTGETIQIPESVKVKFTPGRGLKESVNKV
jgi:DNA-binding protein HU-beta